MSLLPCVVLIQGRWGGGTYSAVELKKEGTTANMNASFETFKDGAH